MSEINWSLINDLATKTHKHLNIVEDAEYGLMLNGVFDRGFGGVGEVMQEARTVQHLLDIAGIPEGIGDSAHIDARVYLLLAEVERLTTEIDERDAELSMLRQDLDAQTAAAFQNQAEVNRLRALLTDDPRHVIEFRAAGWTIKHPLSCRPNLFDCPVSRAAERDLAESPEVQGRFYCDVRDSAFVVFNSSDQTS